MEEPRKLDDGEKPKGMSRGMQTFILVVVMVVLGIQVMVYLEKGRAVRPECVNWRTIVFGPSVLCDPYSRL